MLKTEYSKVYLPSAQTILWTNIPFRRPGHGENADDWNLCSAGVLSWKEEGGSLDHGRGLSRANSRMSRIVMVRCIFKQASWASLRSFNSFTLSHDLSWGRYRRLVLLWEPKFLHTAWNRLKVFVWNGIEECLLMRRQLSQITRFLPRPSIRCSRGSWNH